jgi:hypothetical protein
MAYLLYSYLISMSQMLSSLISICQERIISNTYEKKNISKGEQKRINDAHILFLSLPVQNL